MVAPVARPAQYAVQLPAESRLHMERLSHALLQSASAAMMLHAGAENRPTPARARQSAAARRASFGTGRMVDLQGKCLVRITAITRSPSWQPSPAPCARP